MQLQSIEASSEDEEQESPPTPPVDSPRSDSEMPRPPPLVVKSREMEILEEAMAAAESTLAGVQADLHSAQVIYALVHFQNTSCKSHVSRNFRSNAKPFSCSLMSRRGQLVKPRRG
jgi:hypothetical protein